ncbi:MAG: hypothetical protein WCK17_12295, partial [Verrucomicrobiota bacterium]
VKHRTLFHETRWFARSIARLNIDLDIALAIGPISSMPANYRRSTAGDSWIWILDSTNIATIVRKHGVP